MDYLLACEEHLSAWHLSESSNMEIGAGFERMHTLCLNDVQTYTIIDILELKLSKCYPRRALQKTIWVDFLQIRCEMIAAQDIVINIASMQEMPKQIQFGLPYWFQTMQSYFYKNIMGKYNAADIGIILVAQRNLILR